MRLLLISGTDPRGGGAGAQFLQDALASHPEFSVRSVIPGARGRTRATRLVWRLMDAATSVLPGLREFRYLLYCAFARGRDARRVVAEAGDDAECRLWIVASSIEVLALTARLPLERFDVRTTFWDHPEYLFDNDRLSGRMRITLRAHLRRLIGASRKVSVMGENMAASLLTPGKERIILRHGCRRARTDARGARASRKLRLCFAGSLYAKREWNALVAFLEDRDWCVAGAQVYLYHLGRFPLRETRRGRRVVELGERSAVETSHLLARMDAAFLPYWTDAFHRLAADTAFPSKLSAYVAADLPVLVFAPETSDLVRFVEQRGIGETSATLDADSVAAAVARLLSGIADGAYDAGLRKTHAEDLSLDAFQARFSEFVR